VRGFDGGIASTAGNLVFQGRGNGEFWVYAADTGAVLKVIPTGSHMMAAPTTYSVNGEQYVAVQAGYGGAGIAVGPFPTSSAASRHENVNRIIVFKLGGGPVPLPPPLVVPPFEQPPAQQASAEQLVRGETLFLQECSRCHQFGPSVTPDLRKLSAGKHAVFADIVLKGALAPLGMGRFDDLLSADDVADIHAYLIDEGWKGWRAQQAAAR
jgi:quinohemoprotein ethanol dehydrogenase